MVCPCIKILLCPVSRFKVALCDELMYKKYCHCKSLAVTVIYFRKLPYVMVNDK